jgi:hypothetical protein
MKIRWVVVQVNGEHSETESGGCTTYQGSGQPATVIIKDASGTILPIIDLTPAVTVKVCDDGNATVKGESKTRLKGFAPRGGKR